MGKQSCERVGLGVRDVGEERADPLAEHRLHGAIGARTASGQGERLVAAIVWLDLPVDQSCLGQAAHQLRDCWA